ncbi:MAG: type II toxin-antitoxin system YafQ family toxin [Alphaproteobacteria bacterium]|nr:type II toxin-antitoxin system YafQ family toxin [Alphaproteobacteria bacterium]
MKDLRLTTAFKKDFKRIAKRGYRLALIEAVIDTLRADEVLPPARRDHALKGDFEDCRECHIQPDWLLIYQADEDEVVVIRTGTHTDLFE